MLTHMFSMMLALGCVVASNCPPGEFKLDDAIDCRPFLTCRDLSEVKIYEIIGHGAVKTVYRAQWKGFTIAVSKLTREEYAKDFLHGWSMLLKFQGPLVVEAVGICKDQKIMLTAYHSRGNAVGLVSRLVTYGIPSTDPRPRLRLCHNYAKLMELLHKEKMVNCDSNTLNKTLSQLIVNGRGELLLNDMDSIADNVDGGGVTCGPLPLAGNFVAPEQLSKGLPLPKYDEKTDIWKSASVCSYFLSQLPNAVPILFRLHSVHMRCKSLDPQLRPSARELLDAYSTEIAEHDEL